MTNGERATSGRPAGGEPRAENPRALVFGEALWDLLPSGPVLGGAPLNFAYRLGSLGIPTALVTQVGEDELGERALARMRALGMDLRFVTRSPVLPTGTVPVTLDADRNPSYVIVPDVAYDAVPWTAELAGAVSQAKILCFGTLAQRDERSRATLRRMVEQFSGHLVLVDINLRPKCYRAETVVVTLGALGAVAVTNAGERAAVPGFVIELDDPCGSGDAFAGAFVASLEAGHSLETALTRANALGALVATQPGATHTVAPADMDELIRNGRRAGLSNSACDSERQ